MGIAFDEEGQGKLRLKMLDGMRLKTLGVMMRARSELQGATTSAGTGRVEDEDDLPVK